jgi:hypothetical protein
MHVLSESGRVGLVRELIIAQVVPPLFRPHLFLNGDDIFLFEPHFFFYLFSLKETEMIAQEFQPALPVIYS